ncbi:magnesium transporter [Actinorhabdospora filicis]|uniref:Magnesium transporter n=1 Tax=Actinorhabdospora filicis TaxID=1785913 RepID=A0A9W6SS30_9ACTN|nr:CBS domain-containing protein [Actinorhabdospora filicis]GLZ81880.1 magnesium transporter [Actinorhabdospora filicis]
MSSSTLVYLARLAGTPIFDPNGDQVGRVRDAVTRPRPGTLAPRVLGVVAEIGAWRRIFIPMGRVINIGGGGVELSTGQLNLRKFEARAGEVLVLGELLDRRVSVITEPGEPERLGEVTDIAMCPVKATGDWELARIAVRERGGRLGRSHVNQFDWDEVRGLVTVPTAQGTEGLLSIVEGMRSADVATMMLDLPKRRRVELAAALEDTRLADVMEELPEHDQVDIIAALDRDRAADVLEEMEPDDAADLLAELPSSEQAELLDLMEPEEASPVRQLLKYVAGTAGGMMTSEPIILPPDTTIAEALALIRDRRNSPAIAAQIFVTRPPSLTPTGRYLGIVHFQRLLREPPADLIGSIVDRDIDPLDPADDLAKITRKMATYDLVALPVVEAGRLVGAVTVDDVLDHLLPTDWRDQPHD